MLVKCLAVGALAANCFLVWCEETKEGVVIDPGGEGERILAEIGKEGLQVKYVINTHGHIDHTAANEQVREGTGAKLAIHVDDAPMLSDPSLNLSRYLGINYRCSPPELLLREGDEITVGNNKLTVLHTPGHTRGGISLKAPGMIFTGDTLFAGSVGRTDFPGGSFGELITSIKDKILVCGDDWIVYPGHGPATTVRHERVNNPFL